jgi:hypothetical protein
MIDRVREAQGRNRLYEYLYVGILVLMALTGIGLSIYGVIVQIPWAYVPGAGLPAGIVWPMTKLNTLRAENMSIEYVAAALLLADAKDQRKAAFQLVLRLIERI